MPEIVQLVDAKPGFNAVVVNLTTGQPEFHPVVLWALIEEPCDGGDCGTDECELMNQGVIPLIVAKDRIGITLMPAYEYEECVGVANPNDAIENWVTRAEEYLAMKATGMLDQKEPEHPKWN